MKNSQNSFCDVNGEVFYVVNSFYIASLDYVVDSRALICRVLSGVRSKLGLTK